MRFKFFLLLLLLSTGTARAQEPFYSGKTLRVIVGSSAGNTQDQMTRLVARYVAKYLPGHPNVIVENMSGASSVIAANYLFKVAKGDGLTIGTVSRALYFDQLSAERKSNSIGQNSPGSARRSKATRSFSSPAARLTKVSANWRRQVSH